MTDLLDIPPFLRRSPGKVPLSQLDPRRKIVMPKRRKPKRAKPPTLSDGTRWILRGLHWPNTNLH